MARKVTDGKSMTAQVPANNAYAIAKGDFVLMDGKFGCSFQEVVATPGVITPIALNIEQCEFEVTTQLLTTDAFAVGALVYWDAANRRFTTTLTGNKKVGIVTVAKDTNN